MTHGRLAVLLIALISLAVGCAKEEARGSGAGAEAGSGPAMNELGDSPDAYAQPRVGGRPGGVVGGVVGGLPGAPPPPQPGGRAQLPVPLERKVMRYGQAMLEVASVDAALARLRDLTREAGGYTTSETRARDHQRVNHGRIECRVPAGKLDSVTAALKSLGTVESLTLSTTDITEEYFDLEIRLRNQRALEARLLALLGRPSNKLSDLLDAERELARVRGEIDQMEGRRRFWDNRVELSSLSVAVHEPVPTVGGARGGALSVLRGAFADSANNFVSAIAGIIAVTGGLLPVLASLTLVGWILVRIWRRRRARRAAKRQAARAAASVDERR